MRRWLSAAPDRPNDVVDTDISTSFNIAASMPGGVGLSRWVLTQPLSPVQGILREQHQSSPVVRMEGIRRDRFVHPSSHGLQ